MWNLISHFLTFAGGMASGVMLMCLMQTGKLADVEYRKAGYSKKFRTEHEAEILLHQAAKNHFDELGIKKLPSVKSLREEYTDLLEQKRKAYSAYKQAKNDMKELHNVRANVEYLLEISSPPQPQRSTEKSRQ